MLTKAEADRRLGVIAELFLSDATLDAYGEGLSVREHMLQSSDLAAALGYDEPLIAACLLHDLGWVLPGREHATLAADFLAPLCGAAVAEPIRLHVAAKRYLVTREAGYVDKLSDASRHTLSLQGGPMAAEACDAFERQPGFVAAIALRRVDDDAKVLDRPSRPFEAYAGLLRRIVMSGLL